MWSIIQAAGWPIWPLIFSSVVALALIVERATVLRWSAVLPAALRDDAWALWRQGRVNTETLEQLARRGPLGVVLAAVLREATQRPGQDSAPWQPAIEDAGRAVSAQLHQRLVGLATLASLTPLLGLLGTVIGMIEIFAAQGMGAGAAMSDNPVALAHGISTALYNTAFGLMVAIPSLVAWRAFQSRADAMVLALELEASHFTRRVALGKREAGA
jgi:biopolymer transport protein ExbB